MELKHQVSKDIAAKRYNIFVDSRSKYLTPQESSIVRGKGMQLMMDCIDGKRERAAFNFCNRPSFENDKKNVETLVMNNYNGQFTVSVLTFRKNASATETTPINSYVLYNGSFA